MNPIKELDTTIYHFIPGYEIAFAFSDWEKGKDQYTPVYLEKGSYDSLIPLRLEGDGSLSQVEVYHLFKSHHLCQSKEEYGYDFHPTFSLSDDGSLILIQANLEKYGATHYRHTFLAAKINGNYTLLQEFNCLPMMVIKKNKNYALMALLFSKSTNEGGYALISMNRKTKHLEFERFLSYNDEPVYPLTSQNDSLTKLFHSLYKKEFLRKI
ncbi:MAG: hypothetical protein QE487_14295 [Fluviicola sp.]|nr:hypothetical protein [Fluviicola sp.]